jgi:hypothetical protein
MPRAILDVDYNQFDAFKTKLKDAGVNHQLIAQNGPGGGNPCIALEYQDRDALKAFLLENYDPHMIDKDFDLYCGAQ